jgi:hypothetical protein
MTTGAEGREIVDGLSTERRAIRSMMDFKVLGGVAKAATEPIPCQRESPFLAPE